MVQAPSSGDLTDFGVATVALGEITRDGFQACYRQILICWPAARAVEDSDGGDVKDCVQEARRCKLVLVSKQNQIPEKGAYTHGERYTDN